MPGIITGLFAMGSIKNLADRFKALDFERIKQESLRETAPEIIPDMNRSQLKHGAFSDGTLIEPKLANYNYALKKQERGGVAPFLTPDLLNTGAFQSEITTVITAKTIKTFSLDTKALKLEEKYSPLIYGANSKNLSIYAIENLRPILIKKLKDATVG